MTKESQLKLLWLAVGITSAGLCVWLAVRVATTERQIHGQEGGVSNPIVDLVQYVLQKKKTFEFEHELAKTEKINKAADVMLESDWETFRILRVNKQPVPSSPRLPLEKISEALASSGISHKQLVVVIVPGEGLIRITGSPKPQLFNFVQTLKSNGFSEVVMEVSHHGQFFRVDPAIFYN